MTEKWCPRGDWDTETLAERAEKIWRLFKTLRLPGFTLWTDEKGNSVLLNARGEIVIDTDGDPTMDS